VKGRGKVYVMDFGGEGWTGRPCVSLFTRVSTDGSRPPGFLDWIHLKTHPSRRRDYQQVTLKEIIQNK
jgi:hypothetical protein